MQRISLAEDSPPLPIIPEEIARLIGTRASAGVLLAEGDSWFDYPKGDVLDLLENEYGYDVESVAHWGDLVEDMAYSKMHFDKFAKRLEKLLGANRVPRAILLSGGGNDVAGDEFRQLINAEASTLAPINEDIVRGLIDIRLRDAYVTMIATLTKIAERYIGRPIPIVLHGYDYPVPDGRGFLGGVGKLPGPWLRPGFDHKGYGDLTTNKGMMRELIDRFNTMLGSVSSLSGFTHVRYLDLRGTLRTGPKHEEDWDNELHPTADGFERVAAKFAKLIASL